MKVVDKIKIYTENNIGLVNMTDEFFALYLKKLLAEEDKNILVVTPTLFESNKVYNNFDINENAFLFQSEQIINEDIISKSPETKSERLNVINSIIKTKKCIVFTDAPGYLSKLSTKKEYEENIIKLKIGMSFNIDDLKERLFDNGYERETITTKTGEISVRGFVIDVFPVNEDSPIRIEFFGDEIESIRYFDPSTQKSTDKINEIFIYPFNEKLSTSSSSLYDYMDNPLVFFKDINQLNISMNKFIEDNFETEEEYRKNYFNINDIKPKYINYYYNFDNYVSKDIKIYDMGVKSIGRFNEDISEINKYLKNINKTVIICLKKISKIFLNSLEVPYNLSNIKENMINICEYPLLKGFETKDTVFLSEYELFNKKVSHKRINPAYKYSSKIKDLSKINIGDYVVHAVNGIGIYNGLKTLTKNGVKCDYIEVLYDKKDKLYIPAMKLYLINKFSGKEGYTPKINALNSTLWAKTKERVREKIRYEAERLLKVQAERKIKQGFAFSKDTAMQLMFESEFEYEETEDQRKVTEEIKRDMESITPMDRILCGDVGYGKTEVAFRAMFKCVMDSKQAMYLCPTTLLSRQQYDSAVERFKNYPVKIALLNRFVSVKNTNKIINDFKEGKIDILIGTHKILNDKITPKDLGLLVIDEEQRFGVEHKEKIKEFKSNIDVLTLTATPIPRTLQLAMLGVKSLSIIETPPKNRKAIQTYIACEDDKLIRDVIYKELSRDGQVYVLYNKTEDIELMMHKIQKLVPDARITYAHGQMDKNELEDRVTKFIDKEYDILLCTTIIETGVDISNVNSLIIYDADNFGLSQLYQIRGRIGRSDRIAYAYLMYKKNKVLNETAIKRLNVIKEFTELGSGFSIAARDLSIRGAGDILGAEQAGFIDTVGFDMYMKMLDEEVNRLKGIEVEEEKLEDKTLINIETSIDDSYVSEEDLKIEIHKKISMIKTYDDYKNVLFELEDRFGKVSKSIKVYMKERIFENLINNKEFINVLDNNNYVELIISDSDNSLNYEDLFSRSIKINRNFEFSYINKKLHIKLKKEGDYIDDLIKIIEKM